MTNPRPLRPGDPQWLGPYRLLGIIGEGGQGIVFLGRSGDGQQVAVKLLRAQLSGDPKARSYFAKEFSAARRVQPFCTTRILDADVDGATPYIVSEYVDGPSLRDVVDRQGPRSGSALDRLAVGTANALIAIHRAGVVHRDFKPNNILLGPDGPRVIDFGIAKALDSTSSMTSGIVGTPAYMAPEQLTGEPITPAADVFAWGAVMVYAASGHPPFGNDSIGVVLNKILNAEPELGNLTGALREIVVSCLAKEAVRRPTADQVLSRLLDAATPVPMQAPAPHQWAPVDVPAAMAFPPPYRPMPSGTLPPAPMTMPPAARQRTGLAVLSAVAGVVLVAAGGVAAYEFTGGNPRPGPTPTTAQGSGFNAALTSVANPAAKVGGTLNLPTSSDVDSLDPGNMYYAFMWNFSRLYARPLLTYQAAPGKPKLVPDLATGLGSPSADFKTWTYRLRSGVKFSDGTPVTAKDVKYAVARSNFAPAVLYNGPTYFSTLLDGGVYQGPYKDHNLNHFPGITTPDDQTVVFHLRQPTADFDHLAALPQTAPVPAARDTGAGYTDQVVSTGPYQIQNYQHGKSIMLVRNPKWDRATDPLRSARPDKIVVTLNGNADDIANRLITGQADADFSGSSLTATALTRVQADPALRKNSDAALTGAERFVEIATRVAPFDNLHCRLAVEYATDRSTMQMAYGVQTSLPATDLLPPTVPHQAVTNPYLGFDVTKARAELQACGKPGGFSTNMAIRTGRPKDLQAATILQGALAKVGIRAAIKQYPSSTYALSNAGSPAFVHSNDLGLLFYGWLPDFPTGPGFLKDLVDGRAIVAKGNVNISELHDAQVNSLLDQAGNATSDAERERLAGQLDSTVASRAVIVPLVYDRAFLYRSPRLANVTVSQAYGMYDYLNLSVS
ncbi:MAG: putative serine/threonine protein kinase / transporter substrate-binding protein [Actinomycetia bacterium]|nr:putative serine/threonine protein kinase / transporter substrate-binding protein [Actinomycetes bacterium]